MRTETLWGGQRRAARTHWWREVLAQPAVSDWEEVLDEMIYLQFELRGDALKVPASTERGRVQAALC